MEVLTVRRSGMGGLQHVIVREKQGLSGEEVCNFFFFFLSHRNRFFLSHEIQEGMCFGAISLI